MRFLGFLSLFLIPLYSIAGILKGKITDDQGEELPFATVFVAGTTIGNSTNESGEFWLQLPEGKYKVIAQYIGFQQSSFEVQIKGEETIIHNFRLKAEELHLKEFVLKASEDPAVYIMKQVIAKRKFHLNQIKTFQTDMYLKAVLRTRSVPEKALGAKVDAKELGLDSTGKGILYLLEEFATYYSQNGKEKTKIHSVKESGNPGGLGFSRFPEVISFYENQIQLLGGANERTYISPISDNAFSHYRFQLLGDFTEGNHTIYKI